MCANVTTQTQICPHCAMIRHEKRVRTLFPRSDTVPFIPEPDGSHPAKQTIIDIFRRAIEYTGTQLERPGPDGRGIHRFSEHVCRVSGAQFLTRLGYNIDAVQLIGRWGSDAIKRYIQDSPLMRPQQVTQISTEEHIRTLVKDQMTRSYNQFWIVHSTSGICHIPAIAEIALTTGDGIQFAAGTMDLPHSKKSFNKPRRTDASSASDTQRSQMYRKSTFPNPTRTNRSHIRRKKSRALIAL